MYEQPFTENDLSDYSFLVTGGAGFIGTNILEYLIKENVAKVRVFDKKVQNIGEHAFLDNFDIFKGHFSDIDTCRKVIKNMGYVSNQAALICV